MQIVPLAAGGRAQPGPPPIEPEKVKAEVQDVFQGVSTDEYGWRYASNEDTSRDTGIQVSHQAGSGGCFGPGEHYWRITRPGAEPEETAIKTDVMSSAYGMSINGDGSRVVGQFYQDEDGEYRLMDVPTPGKGFFGTLPAAMRRRGWMKQKVLCTLPKQTRAFDIGPDNQIAVAQDKELLRWTRKGGLKPFHTFPREIVEVEYLSNGTLAVATRAEDVGFDTYLFHPGRRLPEELPYKETFPEHYGTLLRSKVRYVDFLRSAPADEVERFLANCQWLKRTDYDSFVSHESVGDGPVVAVRKEEQLWLYERASGTAKQVSVAFGHPDSQRLARDRYWSFEQHCSMTEDGRYLIERSPRGDVQDVAVHDLTTGKSELIPGARDLKVEGDAITFTIPNGESRTVKAGEAAGCRQQPWFKEALLLDLFDGKAQPKEDRAIAELDESVVVGGVRVKKRDDGQ